MDSVKANKRQHTWHSPFHLLSGTMAKATTFVVFARTLERRTRHESVEPRDADTHDNKWLPGAYVAAL